MFPKMVQKLDLLFRTLAQLSRHFYRIGVLPPCSIHPIIQKEKRPLKVCGEERYCALWYSIRSIDCSDEANRVESLPFVRRRPPSVGPGQQPAKAFKD